MAATVRVDVDEAGIGEVAKSAGVRALLTARAERVLAAARSGAPVDTGAYRDGLHLEHVTTDRAVVRVVGSTSHDMFVEASTGNLARALGSA